MMKKNHPIVVTGANGLVGSAVVEHLRREQYTCVIPLTRDDVDLTDTKATRDAFVKLGSNRGRPFFVFHAAAQVYGLGGNMANQGKSILNNTLINTNVIDAVQRAGGCRKITVMGTNAIYPHDADIPYREEQIFGARPHEGEVAYGQAKRHMLAMLEAYQQSYGLEYTYLVSGNVYGPRDKFNENTGHVVPSLIAKMQSAHDNGKPLTVWGDGSAVRDLIYSKDLARLVLMLMSEDIKPGPINVGKGVPVTIKGLVETLVRVMKISPEIVWDKSKPNGRPDTRSDLSRIEMLGWQPRYDLESGLRETVEWFRHATERA